ncbi:MAG: hypothetical protein QNJ37_14675 [Crocosphaera sp.]|nr:hypothetical protein [Crocosphaera sp.]MDJ0730300.1 hypothetical protein [Crocosphaera sp.]
MQLPNIGKSESILSMLIPGTFLLFNLIIGVYFIVWNIPCNKVDVYQFLKNSGASLSVIVFLLLVCLGYLFGAILRLIKCDIVDKLSGWCLKRIGYLGTGQEFPFVKLKKYRRHLGSFPYLNYLKTRCAKDYPEAQNFYNSTWGSQNNNEKREKSFFNFCKVILISVNETLAKECYAAEALNRYLASMFYGIFISFFIILSILIKFVITQQIFSFKELSVTLLLVEIIYVASAWLILSAYRFIRMKEVETVFAATFAFREKFGT